jgi:hypothetical protein
MLLGRPIISLLYEHGKFSAHATDQAALGLQGYALGLCAYSALKILAPAFYAIDRRRTPMMVSFLSIGLNFGLNWWLAFKLHWGIQGLGLATGCVATFNFALLYWLMRRETRHLETGALAVTFGKLLIPTALLAVICWGARITVLNGWEHFALPLKACALLATIALAGGAFFGAATLLRVEEMTEITALVETKTQPAQDGVTGEFSGQAYDDVANHFRHEIPTVLTLFYVLRLALLFGGVTAFASLWHEHEGFSTHSSRRSSLADVPTSTPPIACRAAICVQ